MSTQILTLTGMFKWSKLRENQKETKYNPLGVYQINLFPDEPSKRILENSGIQVIPKEDSDGIYYQVRRPAEQITSKGLIKHGTPEVFLVKDDELVPFTGDIGNGSKGEIVLTLYDTKLRGKGHRLEKVVVYNLVEYIEEISSPNARSFIPF